MESSVFQIITFYQFKGYAAGELPRLRSEMRELMKELGITGTVILAEEGFNSTVCGPREKIQLFVAEAGRVLSTKLWFKSSYHTESPFRRIDVKIKPEIVTLKRRVDMKRAEGTHVSAKEWNTIIRDPEVTVLDTRNDYEFKSGTFNGAINPQTSKFSELPAFVAANLDPRKNRKIAMFCTGGIRCEKFAPYMIEAGFSEVYQLDGGILKYLEETQPEESLWEGECFVFDQRVTVDHQLEKGNTSDHSLNRAG